MEVYSACVVLLAAAAVGVVGLNIDGDPLVEDSADIPSVVIQVWGNVGDTDQADIETNKIPQKTTSPTLRKLIPNYDFPVVPVVKGKTPPRAQHVVQLCRRPPRPQGWSWRVWIRERAKPRIEIDGRLGLPLAAEKETKEVVIGGKLGGEVEEKTTTTTEPTRRSYTKHVGIIRTLGEGNGNGRSYTKHVGITRTLGEGNGNGRSYTRHGGITRTLQGEENYNRRTYTQHVNIGDKLGEVLRDGDEEEEGGVEEKVTHT